MLKTTCYSFTVVFYFQVIKRVVVGPASPFQQAFSPSDNHVLNGCPCWVCLWWVVYFIYIMGCFLLRTNVLLHRRRLKPTFQFMFLASSQDYIDCNISVWIAVFYLPPCTARDVSAARVSSVRHATFVILKYTIYKLTKTRYRLINEAFHYSVK